jgi:hypothetical protein
MPRYFKIFPPPIKPYLPSARCVFSFFFSSSTSGRCCFCSSSALLSLPLCFAASLLASRCCCCFAMLLCHYLPHVSAAALLLACCCRRRAGAAPTIPSRSQGRAPTPAEQRPLHRPSLPHSSSSRASPLSSSSEPEHCNATSFLPWSSTVQLSSPSCTPTTSPGVAAVMTHELPTSANL